MLGEAKKNLDCTVHIITLGNFDIIVDDKSIIECMGRSYKLLELLKYFISFKNKRLLPESIIEYLFSDNNSADLKNVLRTQIFRLRKLLLQIKDIVDNDNIYLDIEFSNGYYILKIGSEFVTDYEIFEEKINTANKLVNINPCEAINIYNEAINLYTGEYMGEGSFGDWIIPIRNRYNRLYLQTINKLIDLLKIQDKYRQIIDICEKAIEIQPFEEVFHIEYMEGLLKLGQVKQAMSYYEYTTYKMYKDFDIKPSIAMKELYRKIQIENEEKIVTDLYFIEKRLSESQSQGAMKCDLEYFKFLYNLEKRKNNRRKTNDYLGLITINYRNNNIKLKNFSSEAKELLSEILLTNLRKGDVFTFWNDTQVIMILSNVKNGDLYIIEERLKKYFCSLTNNHCYEIRFKYNPINN